jgi:hypothetical protein
VPAIVPSDVGRGSLKKVKLRACFLLNYQYEFFRLYGKTTVAASFNNQNALILSF